MEIFQSKCTHVVTTFSYYNFKISSAYEPSIWYYQLPFYELYISYIFNIYRTLDIHSQWLNSLHMVSTHHLSYITLDTKF